MQGRFSRRLKQTLVDLQLDLWILLVDLSSKTRLSLRFAGYVFLELIHELREDIRSKQRTLIAAHLVSSTGNN